MKENKAPKILKDAITICSVVFVILFLASVVIDYFHSEHGMLSLQECKTSALHSRILEDVTGGKCTRHSYIIERSKPDELTSLDTSVILYLHPNSDNSHCPTLELLVTRSMGRVSLLTIDGVSRY